MRRALAALLALFMALAVVLVPATAARAEHREPVEVGYFRAPSRLSFQGSSLWVHVGYVCRTGVPC